MGQVGRFASVDAVRYPRRSRVVVRTRRGLEIGEVLAPPEGDGDPVLADGQILRGMTVEDELLHARLEKHRQEAYEACAALLAEHGLPAVLLDVEHLLDGQGLYFYFLGDVPPEAERLTRLLADEYEATVEFRKFSDTLANGCGPGCGTVEAMGRGGCESCTTCALASSCGVHKLQTVSLTPLPPEP